MISPLRDSGIGDRHKEEDGQCENGGSANDGLCWLPRAGARFLTSDRDDDPQERNEQEENSPVQDKEGKA